MTTITCTQHDAQPNIPTLGQTHSRSRRAEGPRTSKLGKENKEDSRPDCDNCSCAVDLASYPDGHTDLYATRLSSRPSIDSVDNGTPPQMLPNLGRTRRDTSAVLIGLAVSCLVMTSALTSLRRRLLL